MMKFISLATLVVFSFFASATPITFTCNNEDSSTLVVIEKLTAANAPDATANTTAQATLLVVKLSGFKAGERILLDGQRHPTAKGPYYELFGTARNNRIEMFIASPASKSYDELSVSNRSIEMICDK